MARAAQLVRESLAGEEGFSLAAWARRRRWKLVLDTFPELKDARVLDLGGTSAFWMRAPVQPKRLTVLNLGAVARTDNTPPWVEMVEGDACEAVRDLEGRTFDIVFSNSTIEHVGGHDRCQAFARSVRALAPRHWIQTPYRYFPIEPHYVCPGFQFLPVSLQRNVATWWPLSHTRSIGEKLDDPIGAVMATELLCRTQMRFYFPDSKIVSEKLLGLTKSIVAVR